MVALDVLDFTVELGELGVSDDLEAVSGFVCCAARQWKNESLQTSVFSSSP